MEDAQLSLVVFSGIFAIVLFEIFKFIITNKVQIRLKMQGEPWLLVQQEVIAPQPVGQVRSVQVGAGPSSRKIMPKFWAMHVNDIREHAVKAGIKIIDARKDDLVEALVEHYR